MVFNIGNCTTEEDRFLVLEISRMLKARDKEKSKRKTEVTIASRTEIPKTTNIGVERRVRRNGNK